MQHFKLHDFLWPKMKKSCPVSRKIRASEGLPFGYLPRRFNPVPTGFQRGFNPWGSWNPVERQFEPGYKRYETKDFLLKFCPFGKSIFMNL